MARNRRIHDRKKETACAVVATLVCPWCEGSPATFTVPHPSCEACIGKPDRSAICPDCRKPATPDQELGFGRLTQYVPPQPERWYAYHKACRPAPLCPWCRKYPVKPGKYDRTIGPMCAGCAEDSSIRTAKCYYCGGQLQDWQEGLGFRIPATLGGEPNKKPPHWVGYHVHCAESWSTRCHPSCYGCYVCTSYGEDHPEEF